MFFFALFFFAPPGHFATLFPVRVLYSEPATGSMRYAYIFRVLNGRSVRAFKTPNSCAEGLLVNLFGVRPIPTEYSLHALNPLLPGLEPRPAQSTLTELDCWC